MTTPMLRLAATRSSSRFRTSHDSHASTTTTTTTTTTWMCRRTRTCRGHVRGSFRSLHVPTALMPPLIFSGLFVALWCWKCTMMVLFQNTIIYNPFLPPNARSLRIAEFARQCGGIEWREERIQSMDGTELGMCLSDVSANTAQRGAGAAVRTPVYILYFQGNASSLPPRLPDISWVLRRLRDITDQPVDYTTVCLSYRGYWTSHDRPSERGINMDAEAALRWISKLHETRSAEAPIGQPIVVLWGQSIGCGFATNLAANVECPSNLQLNALVLETPFLSTRAMLQALYPQKWLPYQYLYPFLWNHLDSWANLGVIADRSAEKPGIYMVEAGKDELVPADHGDGLYQRCQDVGLAVERRKVHGALHNDTMVRLEGRQAIAQSILLAVTRAQASGQRNTLPDGKDGRHDA